ncbi:TPA: hypothetical protein LVM22_001180 [Klebsiella oxytoca]|nr:hypothetical protein [Klebsiella oxytoca]
MLQWQFIRATYRETVGFDLHPDDVHASINNILSDHVNTDVVFHSPVLLPVMRRMLDSIRGHRAVRERCRQMERILTLWIYGLDALATQYHDSTLLPRTRPESSGRVDCLLPGEPDALLALTDDEFIQLTSQEMMENHEYITRSQLRLTLPHWQRFTDWLASRLARAGEHCLVQLGTYQRRCAVECREIRRFETDTGYITVTISDALCHQADCDAQHVTDYVGRICNGEFIPVRLDTRVHYHNGAVLAHFPSFRRVRDVSRLTGADYAPVVRLALNWLRTEHRRFGHHLTTPAPALRLVA